MHSELYGKVSRPVIAVIGVWDPLSTEHARLFTHLSEYADRVSLQPLVVMLDPAPPSLINGRAYWPVYDSSDVRLMRIRACGVEAVQVVHFTEQDLDAPVREFFRLIGECAKIDELVLGARQVFGRGYDSSPQGLEELARRHRMQLLRLPPENTAQVGADVRECLRSGRLRAAARLVGRPPVWSRPRRGQLRLAWPAGLYECAPTNRPLGRPAAGRIRVELSPHKDGFSRLSWPDTSFDWLVFTDGPADLRAAVGRRRPAA